MRQELHRDAKLAGTRTAQIELLAVQPGQRIEITKGALRGLQATVVDARGSGRLLVAADGWADGALLAVSDGMVSMSAPP